MSGKIFVLGIWTSLVLVALILAGVGITRDGGYTGTEIEFATGRHLQIEAETVTLEAASRSPFVLRKDSGETIVGVPAQPPLGWTGDNYFVYGPQEVPGGKWLFPNGYATFKITSEETVTVKTVETSPVTLWFVLCFLAVAIWLLGLMLARV